MSTLTRTTPALIRRIDGDTVYERRSLRVTVDQIVRPDGSEGEYVLVDLGGRFGATVIALADDGRVAMVRQHRYPVNDITLELPGGGVTALDPAEALRELVEETGLVADTAELLGAFYASPGSSRVTGSAWLAHVPAAAPGTEFIEGESGAVTEWYTPDEIRTLMATGGIQCAITLAALSLAFAAGKLA